MSVITNFVEHYQGPKLAILATGGGMGLAQIASVPGASRVFHSFYCPYETKESVRFLRANLVSKPEPDGFLASAVSQLAAEEFYEAMESKYRDCNVLVVTAACTSLNFRRGLNRAYIACLDKNTNKMVVWHLKLPKPITSEAEHRIHTLESLCASRQTEDQLITDVALRLVVGASITMEEMIANGTLVRLGS